jgi:hypothetical protein
MPVRARQERDELVGHHEEDVRTVWHRCHTRS